MKNLRVSETVDGSATLEILRCAQDDRVLRGDCHEPIGSRNDGVSHHSRNDAHTNNVILNVVKNLLNDNILSTVSLVGFEGIATSGKPSSQ